MLLKKLLALSMIGIIVLVGCASEKPENHTEDQLKKNEVVKIVYVDWVSEEASAHVVKAVIEEKLGYTCELLAVSAVAMWESVAVGDQDAMVAAWLPSLHQHYLEEHRSRIEDLGPNLDHAITGLVVPEYVTIDSIEELVDYGDRFEYRIIGIDPAAGLMTSSEAMMDQYGLDEFQLISGSDRTMTEALGNAIEDKEWIVITGWTPHWKFEKWNLKYLEDPFNAYGEGERIHTIVRKGLEEDMPEVYRFLDRFYWEPEHMEQVMFWINADGLSPEAAADRWIKENAEMIKEWL